MKRFILLHKYVQLLCGFEIQRFLLLLGAQVFINIKCFLQECTFIDTLQTIEGQILFMDLEHHRCVWDWLEVTSRFKAIGRFCGNQQVDFRSEGMVLLTFQSDAVVNRAGFQLVLKVRGEFITFAESSNV